jgi:signal transduction histidine kinase/ActR/RegA family two-component response regulator
MLLPNSSSIKTKVVAISTLCSALFLCLAAVIIIVLIYMNAHSTAMKTNAIIADILGFHAGAAIVFEDQEAGIELLGALSEQPDILSATIVTTGGIPFSRYTSSRPSHSRLLAKMSTGEYEFTQKRKHASGDLGKLVEYTSEILYLSSPINLNGNRVGTLNLSIDLTPLQKNILQFVIATVFFLVLAFVLAYLLANRLQRSVTGPIDALAATIRAVSEKGDYTQRVERVTNDEIGQLVSNFNFMLKNVEDRDRVLEKLVSQLKLATDAKSAFLANMSHEIRTPMNGILGITSLLLEMPETGKKRAYYKTIDRSAKSLMELINGILDLSKIESGNFTIDEVDFNLLDTIDEMRSLFESVAREKNLQLAFSLTTDTPVRLIGDSTRLRQVLINLVGNALKFTETGSVSVSISAMDKAASSSVLLFEVNDTGIGVPEHAKETIFSDFAQADDSVTRTFGGTGLGLAVSRNIVELMQGQIGVDSIEGRGSRFWFTLPFELSSQETSTPAEKTSSLDSPRERTAHIVSTDRDSSDGDERAQYQARILVVDDSEVNQFILIETIKTFGIDTVAVGSGAEAIAALEEDQFDLVIMDIQMPTMSGIEATARIRKSEQATTGRKPMAIIAFSANAMRGDRERYLRAGMDDYLSKPMQLEAMADVLHKWLGQHRLSA